MNAGGAAPVDGESRLSGRRQPFLQLRHARFELLEAFAGALQHLRLDVEFDASDQIELGEKSGERRANVFLHVARRGGSKQLREPLRKVIKEITSRHMRASLTL